MKHNAQAGPVEMERSGSQNPGIEGLGTASVVLESLAPEVEQKDKMGPYSAIFSRRFDDDKDRRLTGLPAGGN